MNRLELTPEQANEQSRYKKIVARGDQIDDLMVEVCIEAQLSHQEVVLDVDATDDLIYGNQEGRFFHGYYGDYCYLPLYIFWGEYLLCSRLRVASEDPASGVRQELERIVKKLRGRHRVRIIVRGDSGFCRDEIMSYCDQNEKVDYVLGLARNDRLNKGIEAEMAQAQQLQQQTQRAARVFKDIRYRTRKSWSCERRVVGKAEYLAKGANPRYIVTSIASEEKEARRSMRICTARGGIWRNESKSSNWGCLPIDKCYGFTRSNAYQPIPIRSNVVSAEPTRSHGKETGINGCSRRGGRKGGSSTGEAREAGSVNRVCLAKRAISA